MVEEVSDKAEVRQSSSSLLSAAASFRRPAPTAFVFAGNVGIKPATTPLINRFGFRTVLLAAIRVDIAMMRTPDGHGRLEPTKFRTPAAVSAEPANAPANTSSSLNFPSFSALFAPDLSGSRGGK